MSENPTPEQVANATTEPPENLSKSEGGPIDLDALVKRLADEVRPMVREEMKNAGIGEIDKAAAEKATALVNAGKAEAEANKADDPARFAGNKNVEKAIVGDVLRHVLTPTAAAQASKYSREQAEARLSAIAKAGGMPELRDHFETGLPHKREFAKAMDTGSQPSALAIEYLARLIDTQPLHSSMRNYCAVHPMSQHTLQVGKVTSKPAGAWHDEVTEATHEDMDVGNIQLVAEEMIIRTDIPNATLRDDAVSLLDTLTMNFQWAATTLEQTAFATGDAIGKPNGLDNATYTKTVPLASAPTYRDIVRIISKLGSQYLSQAQQLGVAWFMNADGIRILEEILDANNLPIFRRPEDPAGVPTLKGIPVVEVPGITGDGSATATEAYLAAWKLAYHIGDRQNGTFAASEHQLFHTNQTVFRYTKSVDGQPGLTQDINTNDAPAVKVTGLQEA